MVFWDEFFERRNQNLKQLLEIEKIRSLRIKYNQLIDSRDLSQLVHLFTYYGICVFGRYGPWKGSGEIYKNISKCLRIIGCLNIALCIIILIT